MLTKANLLSYLKIKTEFKFFLVEMVNLSYSLIFTYALHDNVIENTCTRLHSLLSKDDISESWIENL